MVDQPGLEMRGVRQRIQLYGVLDESSHIPGARNREAALEWLAKAMDAHQGYMRWVGVIPFLDPLREDPRFQAIIAPLKLPADEP
jgi:hypothetical protein